MATYKFGETILVPFPFVETDRAKQRPAVVISSSSFNGANGQLILAMITSARLTNWDYDIPLQDLDAAGLRHASVIRWKVFTLPEELILRPLGRLGPADMGEVRARLASFAAADA
jgi:mRNA interferase MazF